MIYWFIDRNRSARIETVMEELQQNLKTMCQKIETLVERL